MFCVLLTAVFALGVEGDGIDLSQASVQATGQRGSMLVTGRVELTSHSQADLSCNCIRSSSSYAWRWMGPDVKDHCAKACRRSCPAYYTLYSGTYDFRRTHDYPWRSKSYISRKLLSPRSKCESCGDGSVDEESVTTPKVRVLPPPQ